MSTFLKKYAVQAYALMRIVAGLLFLCHGSQKLLATHGAGIWSVDAARGKTV